MGFSVQIQADYGSEILENIHPDGRFTGGTAVFAFWGGLEAFCRWGEGRKIDADLEHVIPWYQHLETLAPAPLCAVCAAFVDCAWGDGGDSTEYQEDEYAFYRKRSGASLTEQQFLRRVREAQERWKPLDEVIRSVQVLLELFKTQSLLPPLEGVYRAEDTIADFEALLANLEFLANRYHEVVRLNFIFG